MKKTTFFISLKKFIKGSLALVGLFAVLSCVVAVFILNSDKKVEISKSIENVKPVNDSSKDEIKNETSKKIVINKKIVTKENIKNKICTSVFVLIVPFIVFLIVFLFVFFGFSRLAKLHYVKKSIDDEIDKKIGELKKKINEEQKNNKELENKIQDIKNNNNREYRIRIQETKEIIESCQSLVKTIIPEPEKGEVLNNLLEKIIELLSKKCSEEKNS